VAGLIVDVRFSFCLIALTNHSFASYAGSSMGMPGCVLFSLMVIFTCLVHTDDYFTAFSVDKCILPFCYFVMLYNGFDMI